MNITATGGPVTIDGRQYEITAPGLVDWEYLKSCVRGDFIRAAQAANPAFTSEAVRESLKLDIGAVIEWVQTNLSGIATLAHRELLPKHPDLTYEQVYNWVLRGEKELIEGVMQAMIDSLPKRDPSPKNAVGEATSQTGSNSSQSLSVDTASLSTT